MITSGTVLEPDEEADSDTIRDAVRPWRVAPWHDAFARSGAGGADSLPSGRAWRESIEQLSPSANQHLLIFEGHVTHLPDRDRELFPHIDVKTMVGSPERIRQQTSQSRDRGFAEMI